MQFNSTKVFIFLLIGITFLTYFNSLSNGFIGDDHVLFDGNDFYKDLSHLPRLVDKNFVTKPFAQDNFSSSQQEFVSGCVSYRPMTALSFFASRAIWKDRVFGYHLDNVIWHVLTVLAVYVLVGLILKKSGIAFFAALLFGVHPINAEAVNNIGYRSDILCGLFFILSLILFIRSRSAESKGRKLAVAGSCLAFLLALLSKETAVALFMLFIFYDVYFFAKGDVRKILSRRWEYGGYLAILLGYLYLYAFVFPPSTYLSISFGHLLDPNWYFVSAKILWTYLVGIIIPFKVVILPPLYCPPPSSLTSLELLGVIGLVVMCFGAIIKSFKHNKEISFFILWFFVAYLPTANLIPLPNAMAHRFLYIPAIGLWVVLAILIDQLSQFIQARLKNNMGVYLKVVVIGLLMAVTIPHNILFKNDLVCGREMVKNYPDASRPYEGLAATYFRLKLYEMAIIHYNKSLEVYRPHPFLIGAPTEYLTYTKLGMCYVDDPDMAIAYFKRAVDLKSDYSLAYMYLAKAFILKKDYPQALKAALKTIELKSDLIFGYVYAIHSAIELKQWAQAKDLLDKAFLLSPQDPNLLFLKQYYAQAQQL